MVVEINGVPHMFKWHHDNRRTAQKKFSGDVLAQRGSTICFCYKLTGPNKEDRELVHMVKLNCFHKDIYSKEEGRRRSLSAVLDFDRSINIKIDPHDGQPVIKEQYIKGDNKKLEMKHVTIFEMEIKDDGYFNRDARTKVWEAYDLMKFPTPKDRVVQFTNQLEKLIEKFPELEVNVTVTPDITLTSNTDEQGA